MNHLSTHIRYRPVTAGVAAWSKSYTTREVARLVELPPRRLRQMARQGLVADRTGHFGPFHYSFHDLILLRNVRPLDATLPKHKVVRLLCDLKRRLPAERPLHTLRFATWGKRLVVREDQGAWDAETGQVLMDFKSEALPLRDATVVHPRFRKAPQERGDGTPSGSHSVSPPPAAADDDAEALYELGCRLEGGDHQGAKDAYERALTVDPEHVDCLLNLGRLHHEAGEIEAAAEHYRKASRLRPEDPTASFNLGVAFHDLGSLEQALEAYGQALVHDPDCADAHYNLSLLHRQLGDEVTALRHLKAYRRQVKGG